MFSCVSLRCLAFSSTLKQVKQRLRAESCLWINFKSALDFLTETFSSPLLPASLLLRLGNLLFQKGERWRSEKKNFIKRRPPILFEFMTPFCITPCRDVVFFVKSLLKVRRLLFTYGDIDLASLEVTKHPSLAKQEGLSPELGRARNKTRSLFKDVVPSYIDSKSFLIVHIENLWS